MPKVKKYHKSYIADFETSGELMFNNYGRADVYLGGIVELREKIKGDDVILFTKIKDFFKIISKLGGRKKTNILVYFHNLTWDGYFILDYLKNNNIPHDTLIDERGKFYSIFYRVNTRTTVTFYCSYLNTLMAVKNLPGSTKTEDLDYNKDYKNYKLTDFSEKEINYLKQDILTVARVMFGLTDSGINHTLTIASRAYKEMKESLNRYDNPRLNYSEWLHYKKWYRGGIALNNIFYVSDKVHYKKLYGYDETSAYPYIMAHYQLPIGRGVPLNKINWDTYPLKLFEIKINWAFIKPNRMPFIDFKGTGFSIATYAPSQTEPILIYLTELEFNFMLKNYELDYEIISGLGFEGKRGELKEYVYDNFEGKKNAKNPYEKLKFKLKLNSGYGKFGQKPVNINLSYSGEGWEKTLSQPTDDDYFNAEANYIPKAIFITAYARMRLVEFVNEVIGYSDVVLGDTDSVYSFKNTDIINNSLDQANKEGRLIFKHILNLDKNKSNLGDWGLEFEASSFKIIGPKKYVMKDEQGNLKIAMAGVKNPYDKIKDFSDIYEGKIFPNIKRKLVKGGPVLMVSEFKMNFKNFNYSKEDLKLLSVNEE